jgi:hypothetical protein
MAPAGLETRRQLRARGLRPGGQPPAGQILWAGVGGTRTAYLYDITRARPRRRATPAVVAACGRALAARRRCPTCSRDAGYVIPQRYGECLDCHGIYPATSLPERTGA